MRVLVLAYTYYSSDPRVMREAEAISQRGDHVEVLCLRRKEEPSSEVVQDILVRHLPVRRYRGDSIFLYFLTYLRFLVISFFTIATLHVKKSYQIIHVHTMPDFLVFAAFVPRITGAKVILDMHDLMPETYETKFAQGGFLWRLLILIEKIATRFAHHVITVHEPYVGLIQSRGVPGDKLTAILNLPDEKIFYPRPFERDEVFTISYFGTIAKRHGIDLVLRALAQIKEEALKVRFLIIGEGDALPQIKRLIKELELGNIVDLIDQFVNVRELPSYIQKSHLGIIPYRAETSTQNAIPVKLLEYIYMEVPVVSSRLEVICAYFSEDMIYFILPEDIGALAKAIRDLYHSKKLRTQLVENARLFTQEYDWTKERQKLYAVYDQLTRST